MLRLEDHFEPPVSQLLSCVLSRREGRGVRGGLGTVPGHSCLAHQEIGECQKQKPGNDRDVDGKRLPRVTASTEAVYSPPPPVSSVIF
ncbi:hypothetical protein GCM10010299_03960 [Streptomyces tanashiensis]|nr:hypothetical protein GCM10010299_03960 [Streptomyces tanashiensis]